MPALLIDVRSSTEFAAGFLEDAINIEYLRIQELAMRPGVFPDSEITLYCHSGRRSAIALHELQSSGFTNVRDIGGFEEARQTLEEERKLRGDGLKESKPDVSRALLAPTKKDEVQKSFEKLLAGLGGESTGS